MIPIPEWKLKDVAKMKELRPELREYEDKSIVFAYMEWSDIYHAAGWYGDADNYEKFTEWATTTPLEYTKKTLKDWEGDI